MTVREARTLKDRTCRKNRSIKLKILQMKRLLLQRKQNEPFDPQRTTDRNLFNNVLVEIIKTE